MKFALILTFLAALALALALPQVGHGSINGPSGRFAMTRDWASPPVDLRKPIVFLREATPIHEEPQESRSVQTRRRPKA
ncbi:uncharacterized protein LOC111075606 [Drosophila obscura]|uniref:uncharacterized protein LOC111075606 n=1 Tax=Drosophila obscura TaxID=7282 RepID=UPI000BA016EA|nr:uncharacterized protein LOC111075606 [Drosophila obscura]